MSITGHDGGGVGMTTVGGDGVASGGSGDGAAVVGAGVAGAAVGTTVTGAVVGCADGGSATVQSTEQHVAPPTTCMQGTPLVSTGSRGCRDWEGKSRIRRQRILTYRDPRQSQSQA